MITLGSRKEKSKETKILPSRNERSLDLSINSSEFFTKNHFVHLVSFETFSVSDYLAQYLKNVVDNFPNKQNSFCVKDSIEY